MMSLLVLFIAFITSWSYNRFVCSRLITSNVDKNFRNEFIYKFTTSGSLKHKKCIRPFFFQVMCRLSFAAGEGLVL